MAQMNAIASIMVSMRDCLHKPAVLIQRSWRGFVVRRSSTALKHRQTSKASLFRSRQLYMQRHKRPRDENDGYALETYHQKTSRRVQRVAEMHTPKKSKQKRAAWVKYGQKILRRRSTTELKVVKMYYKCNQTPECDCRRQVTSQLVGLLQV